MYMELNTNSTKNMKNLSTAIDPITVYRYLQLTDYRFNCYDYMKLLSSRLQEIDCLSVHNLLMHAKYLISKSQYITIATKTVIP